MDFAILPPEVNSSRMYAGAGPGPLLAATAAWDGLANELSSAAAACQSVISQLTVGWLGPASTAMASAAALYAAWLHSTAALAEQTAAQAKAAVAAYETAFVMTVPPPVIAANRAQLAALVATNFLGQNTASIAATEAQYGTMWAQDAAAMYGYAAGSASASTLTPFTPPGQTTNPGGPANQAAAVAQATATAAAAHTQTTLSSMSAVPQALHSLASPTAMAQGTLKSVSSISSLGPGAAATLTVSPALATGTAGLATDLLGTFGVDTAGTFGIDTLGTFGIDLLGVGEIGGAVFPPLPLVPAAELTAAPVTADLGQAVSVRQLSVPPAWAVEAPAFRPVALALPTSSAGVATEVMAGTSVNLLSDAAMAGLGGGLAGRALGSTAALRRREPARATNTEPAQPPSDRVAELAADLRELAALRDSGILTDEEFTEEKRRLLGR
jgi:PPE-repeat protein